MFSGVGNVEGETGLKTARIAPVQSCQIEEYHQFMLSPIKDGTSYSRANDAQAHGVEHGNTVCANGEPTKVDFSVPCKEVR